MKKGNWIMIIVLALVIGFLGYTFSNRFNTIQESVMYVTAVEYDSFSKATHVYSYKHELHFKGIHKEIGAKGWYYFKYRYGVPWSTLLDIQISSVKETNE